MLKKTISILLAFVITLTVVLQLKAYCVVKDYTGHWAEETIQEWLDKNYITGYMDGFFKPDELVTRAEFVKMVNNAFNFNETSDINFGDVKSNEWYYQDIQRAFKAGYIKGVSQTEFAPNDNLSREQAAVIVSRIMALEGNEVSIDLFEDNSDISDYAIEGVRAAVKAELIKGYGDNTFRPKDSIKRAEAVVILDRAISYESYDLTIDEAGTVIENKSFENVYITAKVGEGEVILKNVTITGKLLVEGGGVNSIILDNSTINNLISNKSDGKVRILITGNTAVESTTILSGTTLEQQNLSGTGFNQVIVDENVIENQILIVSANVGDLKVEAKIEINIQDGTIERIEIGQSALGSNIDLSEDATALLVEIDVQVSFTGQGTIVNATINANYVTFEQEPESMNVAPNIEQPIIGGTLPIFGGGGGGGGTLPGPSEPTLNSLAITTRANKLVYFVGDELDITGLVVTGTYSDGSTKTEAITSANITGFNSLSAVDSQQLTITVGGRITTYIIQIKNKAELIWDISSNIINASTGQLEKVAITTNLPDEIMSLNARLVIDIESENIETSDVDFYEVSGIDFYKEKLGGQTIKFTTSEIVLVNGMTIDLEFKFNQAATYNMKIYLIDTE